ncbi:MAG: bifunctional 3-deoxy-7-phosphoheptulonate synthase/chorismate mutase [Bacteroidia bacterium]|nr:bifunctional 3-deoxy-7-phosphoheptulonate synthase/chorismate mutase [Bacteroidia bacterium]
MIIQLTPDISPAEELHLHETVRRLGYTFNQVTTRQNRYLIALGKTALDPRAIGSLPGVRDIHIVTDPYQLVSRKWRVHPTRIELGDGVVVGGGGLSLMAGPCSIETDEQVAQVIAHLQATGVTIMRGGVFKPRSSPYSFRGLGIEGLQRWHAQAQGTGIKIITEVMEPGQIEAMYPYVDIFQVGARNSQNFNLLDALGQTDKPVMLKRGISGTIEELLYSAEYIFSGGNEHILLCERGIRSYETAYRNLFDVNAIALLKDKTHLPVIADPSHGIGLRDFVEPVALAALMAGADGLIFEIHPVPEKASSDAQQTLSFAQSAELTRKATALHALQQQDFVLA